MRLNHLEVTFHRTVRVAEGREPSDLPPSLGRMQLYAVADYRANCPKEWPDDAAFMALHDVEAMWLAFRPIGKPAAVLVGAGGLNALDGRKLGTRLEKENYLVCPPQPWLDGWKDVDGTVHQFVATQHKQGGGLTVAEQVIGDESKTGAMGLAVFEPRPEAKLEFPRSPLRGIRSFDSAECSSSTTMGLESAKMSYSPVGRRQHVEMGLGKGGKIIQKVYEDPHGIEVWQEKPAAVFAFYLVDAKTAEEITGEKVPDPVTAAGYQGPWYGLDDEKLPDWAGSKVFSGLKSAAFPGEKHEGEKGKSVPVSVQKGA